MDRHGTEEKDQNLADGFCCSKAFGLLDPTRAKGWYVLGRQGVFRVQTKVKAKRTTLKNLQQTNMHAPPDDALPVIQFEGENGLIHTSKTTKEPSKPSNDKSMSYRQGSQNQDPTKLLTDSSGRLTCTC